MITYKFINLVHNIFDELNYRIDCTPNYDNFLNSTIDVISHCSDLEDAINAVNLFRYCNKKWSKIEKMFRTKIHKYNDLEYHGNELISLRKTTDCYGRYFITNALSKKLTEIYLIMIGDNDKSELYSLDYSRKTFSFGEDSQYYLKPTTHSKKMKILDSEGDVFCLVVLDPLKDGGFAMHLDNNHSAYELDYDNETGEILIFDKNYYDSVPEGNLFEEDKTIATIYWDIIDKKVDNAVSELTIYNSSDDFEFFSLLAVASFMLFHSYMKSIRTASELSALNAMRAIRHF